MKLIVLRKRVVSVELTAGDCVNLARICAIASTDTVQPVFGSLHTAFETAAFGAAVYSHATLPEEAALTGLRAWKML